MSIFDKWDKNVDTEGLQKDIAEAEANGGQGDYREVPVGTYEVKIDKMEIKECGSEKHAGEPMFTVQFRILEGDFENSCLFMNQLITEGWQIGQVNKFLRSLDVNDTVEFKTYGNSRKQNHRSWKSNCTCVSSSCNCTDYFNKVSF